MPYDATKACFLPRMPSCPTPYRPRLVIAMLGLVGIRGEGGWVKETVRIEARWTLSDLLLEVRQRHDVVVSQVHVRPVEG